MDDNVLDKPKDLFNKQRGKKIDIPIDYFSISSDNNLVESKQSHYEKKDTKDNKQENIILIEKDNKKEKNKKKFTFKKRDIIKSIPKEHYDEPNEELSKNLIEWRWRFITMDKFDFIEVSQKTYNKERLYINNECKWVNREVPSDYDKFVTKVVYAYMPSSQDKI
jgi:hypothetical protein